MIYITGDTHCPTGMDKLNETNFPQQKHMTKKDYVIICGDFGDIWSAKSNEQKDMLQWLSQRNFTTLFLDGNWENYGKLNSLTITVWNGGSAHRLTDSVIHLMRGQIYTLNRRSFFVMGGACSNIRSSGKRTAPGGLRKCLVHENTGRPGGIWRKPAARWIIFLPIPHPTP